MATPDSCLICGGDTESLMHGWCGTCSAAQYEQNQSRQRELSAWCASNSNDRVVIPSLRE